MGYKAEIICRLTETHNQSLMTAMTGKSKDSGECSSKWYNIYTVLGLFVRVSMAARL